MAAARERHDGVLNIPDLMKRAKSNLQNPVDGSVHSILQNGSAEFGSTYHSYGGSEEDMLEESDVYVDLGEDPEDGLVAALAKKAGEAKANGLSTGGASRFA